jgi:xylan 1,4-beta-xylosidase
MRNPLIAGFHPDPSVVKVGDDYYLANSTFEYLPGIPIFHSTDCESFELLTHVAVRDGQLGSDKAVTGGGAWAPTIRFHDDTYWLVIPDMMGGRGNVLYTAKDPAGPWSDGIVMDVLGIDPDIAWDDDGTCYVTMSGFILNELGELTHLGITQVTLDTDTGKAISDVHRLWSGTGGIFPEAPHLYQRAGWYYLITAEGGTGWGHAVTMARSRTLAGPYELHPDGPILSSRHRPDVELQRAGHADLVETPAGETYMVYLCGRPLRNRGRCTLGRETAIQKMIWGADGWLRTTDGQGLAQTETEAPNLPAHPFPAAPARQDFDAANLPIEFQWLRSPWPDELFSLTARPGHLRLFGRETIGSQFKQALVARRQQAHCCSVSTVIEFEAEHFQQLAGLVCYYNAAKFHYLHVSHDETIGKHLRVMTCTPDSPQTDSFTPPIAIPSGARIELRAEIDQERLLFAYRIEERDGVWQWLPQQFDASILSDEATAPGAPNFTGAFVGVACQDMSGAARPADFDWFEYRERAFCADPRAGA